MTKTWTVAGALDLGLQGLGEHLERITTNPTHDLCYTKQLEASVKALCKMAQEVRDASNPKNAPSTPDSLLAGIVEALQSNPGLRLQVEQALRAGRAS